MFILKRYKITRKEKIDFIKESCFYFEDCKLEDDYFKDKTDEELDEEVERYNYLWDK